MKFAIVEGKRREAEPDLLGQCRNCGAAMIAKCGPLRVWHWAHRGKRNCDPWWENETEWHRAWKNRFPEHWQERSHQSENGEKHIADVKTDRGLVLEFQHSFLPPGEREAREKFYRKMVWIVDGRRRKRDRKQFFSCLDARAVANGEPRIVAVLWKEGALLRDWEASRVPVYFDFGDSEPEDALSFDTPTLLRLKPCDPNGKMYLSLVSKTSFLDAHLKGEPFEETCTEAVERAAADRVSKQAPQPLPDFERYMARLERARPRF
jgi:competence protein CoiA